MFWLLLIKISKITGFSHETLLSLVSMTHLRFLFWFLYWSSTSWSSHTLPKKADPEKQFQSIRNYLKISKFYFYDEPWLFVDVLLSHTIHLRVCWWVKNTCDLTDRAKGTCHLTYGSQVPEGFPHHISVELLLRRIQ